MESDRTDASPAAPPERRRTARRVFFAVYLSIQLLVPLLGLYAAHASGRSLPFCWHMYAFMPHRDVE